MICADFPGGDDNFFIVICPGKIYSGNSLCITEGSMPDTFQKAFVCQKIVTEMWPVASGIGYLPSRQIYAWQWNNAACPHYRRHSGVSPQEF